MSLINRAEVPESWRPCLHPCFDVYYFNLGLRLLTTEDIRRPELRALLLEIRNDCFEELADNSDFQKLPIDWVMTISDCNLTERTALVGIHSRSQAKSYRWSKPGKLNPALWEWDFLGLIFFSPPPLYYSQNGCRENIDLVECSKEVFWAYIADYPAHERSIPLLLENEFVRALINGERSFRTPMRSPSTDTRLLCLKKLNKRQGKVDLFLLMAPK